MGACKGQPEKPFTENQLGNFDMDSLGITYRIGRILPRLKGSQRATTAWSKQKQRGRAKGCRIGTPGGMLLLAFLIVGMPSVPTQAEQQFQLSPGGALGGALGGPLGAGDREVAIESQFTEARDGVPGMLAITATISPGYHVYAVDQGQLPDGGGGPMATRIEIQEPDSVRLRGDFRSFQPPLTHLDREVWPGLEMREHEGRVTWYAPIELPEGVEPATLVIKGQVHMQACNPQACVPLDVAFEARLGKDLPVPPALALRGGPSAEAGGPGTGGGCLCGV